MSEETPIPCAWCRKLPEVREFGTPRTCWCSSEPYRCPSCELPSLSVEVWNEHQREIASRLRAAFEAGRAMDPFPSFTEPFHVWRYNSFDDYLKEAGPNERES